MISQILVELIEKNADHLANAWLKDVRHNPKTTFFRTFREDLLLDRARHIYQNLSHWLNIPTPKEQTMEFYKNYGRERCQEGFPLAELIYSVVLFRRHLWLFVLHSGFYDSAYELLRVLELNNRVILFFDRVLHSVSLGYEECWRGKSQ